MCVFSDSSCWLQRQVEDSNPRPRGLGSPPGPGVVVSPCKNTTISASLSLSSVTPSQGLLFLSLSLSLSLSGNSLFLSENPLFYFVELMFALCSLFLLSLTLSLASYPSLPIVRVHLCYLVELPVETFHPTKLLSLTLILLPWHQDCLVANLPPSTLCVCVSLCFSLSSHSFNCWICHI